jgi:PAS domain S-box-containing protein
MDKEELPARQEGIAGTDHTQWSDRKLRGVLKKAEKKIGELKESEKKHKKSQKILEKLTRALKERVKELNCLYAISSIVEKQGLTLEEVLQGTVDIIPKAWQYPEITCSRIMLGEREFRSARFTETVWRQSQRIVLHGTKTGFLEVFYSKEKPREDEGPFLKEERSLINVIAERIGEIVERKNAQEALQESESKNRALLDAIPDLMFQIDGKGVIIGFHEGQFEIPRDFSHRLVGKNIYAIPEVKTVLSKRVLDQVMTYARRALETGRVQVFEQHISHNGERRDVEVRMVVYTNNNTLGIVRDITRRKRLENEILEISGREQRRIGQDLHDSLSQHLAGIGFMGKALEKKVTAHQPLEPTDVSEIVRLIDQAITLTRSFARGLNPVRIEADGLIMALSELSVNVEKRFSISCSFEYSHQIQIDDNAVETHLYRIVQEALNNAIKHGKAHAVTIKLHQGHNTSTLTVEDDGCGIGNAVSHRKGMGLNIMRYRASVIGASLDIRGGERGGTILTCSFQNNNNA